MGLRLDWGVALQVIAMVTILSSAGFGLLALLTESRTKTGQLTQAGRWAGIGIVLSAALSVSSNIFESQRKKEEAEAERVEADKRAAIAATQLDQLNLANQRVTTIQSAAQQLQTKQDNALQRTQDLVTDVARLRTAQERATRETKQDIWRAANKLQVESLRLDIMMECMVGAAAQFQFEKLETLFSDDSAALIQVARRPTQPPTLTENSPGQYENYWDYRWGAGAMLFWGPWHSDQSEFSGFRRVDTTAGLQSLDQLRSAKYWVLAKFDDVKLSKMREFSKSHFSSVYIEQDGKLDLRCKATLFLFINNVQIAQTPAIMRWEQRYEADGDEIGVVSFSGEGVIAPNAVPRIGVEAG